MTDPDVDELVADLTELAKVVIASGEIPSQTPMGLDLGQCRLIRD